MKKLPVIQNEVPLRLKPHHAEGAQRFMAWGKNDSHKIMLDLLKGRLLVNPEAEVVFVRDFDQFCKQYCIEEDHPPDCNVAYGGNDVVEEMDMAVAREHGWEFDKPYKIKGILDQLEKEAVHRNIFYITKLTRRQFRQWQNNVRYSKNRTREKN